MSRRRLLVVAPRIWPLVDDGALRLLHWASQLQQHGYSITVLTPRWHESWPAESNCREISIVRLLPPPKSSWSQSNLLRSMARWIVLHRADFDAIYVEEPFSMLHQVVQTKVAQGLPVVGRFCTSAISAENRSPEESIRLASDGCRKLQKVIVPDAISHRRLKALGIADDRIVRIPDALGAMVRRDEASRRVALHSLAKVSGDLFVPQGVKVILCLGNINRRAGIQNFCQAVGVLLDENAPLRVWLMGQGDSLRSLHAYLKDRSWHRDIQLHGCFDAIEDLIQVADLCVFPGQGCGLQYYLPSVVASGATWFATDSQDIRGLIGTGNEAILCPSGDPTAWTERLRSWMVRPNNFDQTIEKARSFYFENREPSRILEEWDRLFDGLVDSP